MTKLCAATVVAICLWMGRTHSMASHAHLQLGWRGGAPTLGIYDFEAGSFPADAFPFVVGSAGMRIVPAGAQFGFLGAAGGTFFVLPQEQHPELAYLGIGVDPIPVGTPAASTVRLRLCSVVGPGFFAAYQVGSFGEPSVRMNSRDGIGAEDGMVLAPGAHEHLNWAFNAPGEYQVTFIAEVVWLGTGQKVTSEPATYRFHVVPPAGARLSIEVGRGENDTKVLVHSRVGAKLELQESTDLTNWFTSASQMLATPSWEYWPTTGASATRHWRVREIFD